MDVSISLCHFGTDSFSLDSYSVDGTTFLIHQSSRRREKEDRVNGGWGKGQGEDMPGQEERKECDESRLVQTYGVSLPD